MLSRACGVALRRGVATAAVRQPLMATRRAVASAGVSSVRTMSVQAIGASQSSQEAWGLPNSALLALGAVLFGAAATAKADDAEAPAKVAADDDKAAAAASASDEARQRRHPMLLFTGNANVNLAKRIGRELGVSLGNITVSPPPLAHPGAVGWLCAPRASAGNRCASSVNHALGPSAGHCYMRHVLNAVPLPATRCIVHSALAHC